MWKITTFDVTGLNACKNSSLKSCKQFLIGTLTCSLLPIIIGMVSHAQVGKIITLNYVIAFATLDTLLIDTNDRGKYRVSQKNVRL